MALNSAPSREASRAERIGFRVACAWIGRIGQTNLWYGGEMLGLLNLAVHACLLLAEPRSMIYALPTFYDGIGEMVEAHGRGLAAVIDPGSHGFDRLDEVAAVDGTWRQSLMQA